MIETYFHAGPGYKPFLIRDSWQEAQLNYQPDLRAPCIQRVGDHATSIGEAFAGPALVSPDVFRRFAQGPATWPSWWSMSPTMISVVFLVLSTASALNAQDFSTCEGRRQWLLNSLKDVELKDRGRWWGNIISATVRRGSITSTSSPARASTATRS